MNIFLQIFLITLLTGAGGLALGAAVAALVHRPSTRQMSLLLRFTAGVMLSVVCFDLVADARESMETFQVILWIAVGFLAIYLLNAWIDKRAPHSHDHEHTSVHGVDEPHLRTMGLVIAGAVALHNMPVGMAIGATFAGVHHTNAGILAALTIGLHNLPEGMSIAAPLLSGGAKRGKAIGIAAVSGLPTIVGALLGYGVGAMNSALLGVSLSFAGGAMLYVVFSELLPESEHLWRHRLSGVATLTGILLGLALIGEHVH